MNIGSPSNHVQLATKKSQTLLWGVTGEQKWTSALTTGELHIIFDLYTYILFF